MKHGATKLMSWKYVKDKVIERAEQRGGKAKELAGISKYQWELGEIEKRFNRGQSADQTLAEIKKIFGGFLTVDDYYTIKKRMEGKN